SVEGTTRRLVNQTLSILSWAAQTDTSGQPVGQLGHSMATDVIIRAADEVGQPAGPIVALSAFSGAVTPTEPANLLMIAGEWEARLREFGVDAVQMVQPTASEGDLIETPNLQRQATIAPKVEHVGILYSQTAQSRALDWFNTFYQRTQTVPPLTIGPWLLVLLGCLVVLGRRVVQRPAREGPRVSGLRPWQIAVCLAVPAVVAPGISVLIDIDALPVLVADYLLVHLALYGVTLLGLLWVFGVCPGRIHPLASAVLAAWGIAVFGLALHRYGANFWPAGPRVLIVAALIIGAVPFAIADAMLTYGRAWWLRAMVRVTFVGSLMLAVALDFDRLFFLVLIAPIILLFFAIFGPLGRWASQSSGPLTAGLGLGAILAWALGVTFPLFEAV
ncbi:MAG: alpha/beta hydrolase, partial [Pseudomonadota bacterium]